MYHVDKTHNAVFSLQYYLITVVKYRKKVFGNDKLVEDLKTMIVNISKDFDVEIIEQECGEDHIHILFRGKPTLDITRFINVIKGQSSRELREKYKEYLKDKLWGDAFWSGSYFIATSGNVTIDKLKEYIESQRTD